MALQEGLDFYFEDGLMVLTEDYLRNRGYCCENGCRHCPYCLDTNAAEAAIGPGTTEHPQEGLPEPTPDPEA